MTPTPRRARATGTSVEDISLAPGALALYIGGLVPNSGNFVNGSRTNTTGVLTNANTFGRLNGNTTARVASSSARRFTF